MTRCSSPPTYPPLVSGGPPTHHPAATGVNGSVTGVLMKTGNRAKPPRAASRLVDGSVTGTVNHTNAPPISKSSAHIKLQRRDQLRLISPVLKSEPAAPVAVVGASTLAAVGGVSTSEATSVASYPATVAEASTPAAAAADLGVASESAAPETEVAVVSLVTAGPRATSASSAAVTSVDGTSGNVSRSSREERVERSEELGSDSGDEVFLTIEQSAHPCS